MDFQAFIPQLVSWGIEWVKSQRDLHRPAARSLTVKEKAGLSQFFDAAPLEVARVDWLHLISDPPFYADIRRIYPQLPLIPFSNMSGITFADTILLASRGVHHDPPAAGLLFHELVHVVQYEIMGIEPFITRYARGYFEHGSVYEGIPLERHAYELQARYERAQATGFSVRAEVLQKRGAY